MSSPPSVVKLDNMKQDVGKLTWQSPEPEIADGNAAPSKRSGHTFTVIGNSGFLFGGCDSKSPPGPSNTVHLLTIRTSKYEWSEPEFTGEPPCKRYKHSAIKFDNTKILYFGGFHSPSEKLNDVFVLDTTTRTWTQPLLEEGREKQSAKKLPPPRGAHAACMLGKQTMYIVGGYGGHGYKRQDLNDAYALCTETFVWRKIHTRGKPPAPRSGHSISAVEHNIFLYGGWNSQHQFNDLWILDTSPEDGVHLWSHAGVHGPPRWNHCTIAIEAIPHHKLFVFGGNSEKLGLELDIQVRFSCLRFA